ncbi:MULTISPECIES: hypothetical protein [unclassified Acinetobacter]|uniref:hypothetical protein n=1 Tax=unclassified Acinetobacter TaxID=196816 RepID=UPI0018ABECC5|nr:MULTISPECIES: hypothetical protein [unclassified Acinetobacter]MBJ9954775.1 hypothetical protein [Acinetobacter baumannii]
MSFKIQIELLNESDLSSLDFESNASTQILNSFDQIGWLQQAVWAMLAQHQGDFPFFQVEHIRSGRKFGGLFIAYSHNRYNFNVHAELYQKQQKSHFFGLFKSESMPSFDNDNLPFEVFRDCLEKFLRGNDSEIERLLKIKYKSYAHTDPYDK